MMSKRTSQHLSQAGNMTPRAVPFGGGGAVSQWKRTQRKAET